MNDGAATPRLPRDLTFYALKDAVEEFLTNRGALLRAIVNGSPC